MTEVKHTIVEQNALKGIPLDQRQSWGSLALIWIGAMICVPSLMIGGLLVSGLTVAQAFWAGITGYCIVVLFMFFQGMEAADTGLPTVSMAASAFGEQGSKVVISITLAIACLGWFGFQANVCGAAFSGTMSIMGINIPVWISSLVWGFIMLITAIYGFNALKYLNYIAVPALILVSLYGVYAAFAKYGTSILFTHQPAQPMSFLTGIAMSVGSFAVGGVIAGDYSRYARSRKDVMLSSAFGVIPAGVAMIVMGGAMSLVAGTYDITAVMTDLGIPAIGLIALILATWTTNTVNAYSGGLAITNLFNLPDSKRSTATAAAGALGTILAVAGIINHFVGFLTILTSTIPPIAGVMIADYWLIKGGKPESFKTEPGFNITGIAAWLLGSVVCIIVKMGIQPVNGLLVAMLAYYLLRKLTADKKHNINSEREM